MITYLLDSIFSYCQTLVMPNLVFENAFCNMSDEFQVISNRQLKLIQSMIIVSIDLNTGTKLIHHASLHPVCT